MAFNPLEYLKHSKTDFLFRLTDEDHKLIISDIKKSNEKNEIINAILPILKDELPYFCFQIIYDNDLFLEESTYLFEKYYKINNLSKEDFQEILNNSKLGLILIPKYFDLIINTYIYDLDFILKYLFNNYNQFITELKLLSLHNNLHIRFLFMNYLIKHESDKINIFYDDITKYLTSETHQKYEQINLFTQYMNNSDISKLANSILESKLDYNIYLKIKEFIFNNYCDNSLLKELLDTKKIDELKKDADNYFMTASSGKINILNNYENLISKELINSYKYYISFFQSKRGLDVNYSTINYYHLEKKLQELVDKYLSLSKTDIHRYIQRGTTASCHQIGDYVFKLIVRKWSFENVICPNLYLILPNLEEELIRDEKNTVCAGIEVQKYLEKDIKDVPNHIFKLYEEELDKLGFYTTDTLKGGIAGDNTRLLDNYQDSGNFNPPEWFKEYPVVLVDRDRVYQKNNLRPKQLHTGNY